MQVFGWFWPRVVRAAEGTEGGEAAPEPEAQAPEVEAAPSAEEPAEPKELEKPKPAAQPAAPTDWRDRRIAQLTARLREAETRAKEAPAQTQPADIEALATARANEIAAAQRFNDQCNEVAKQGKQNFEDFDSRVASLTQLVDRSDPKSIAAYNQFLSAAIETGEAAKIIHELGGDLNEASRIMSLSPTKMGVELGRKIASGESPLSRTPKPITPIGSRGAAHEMIDPTDTERADRLSTRAWMERREAQLRRKN